MSFWQLGTDSVCRYSAFEALAPLDKRSPKPNASFTPNLASVGLVSENLDNKPICYAAATAPSTNPAALEDFEMFAWINERGLWGRN